MEQGRIRLGGIGVVLQRFQGQQYRSFWEKADQLLLCQGGKTNAGLDECLFFLLKCEGFGLCPGIRLEECFLALFLSKYLGGSPGLGFALRGALSAAGRIGQPDRDDHGEC